MNVAATLAVEAMIEGKGVGEWRFFAGQAPSQAVTKTWTQVDLATVSY
jgi:hypothetical protein